MADRIAVLRNGCIVQVDGEPMRRVRLTLAGQAMEVLRPEDAWLPAAGETCNLDLSRAKVYGGNWICVESRAGAL